MRRRRNHHATNYALVFTMTLFILLVKGQFPELFQSGTGNLYHLTSTVSLNEPAAERKGEGIGFQVRGEVSVEVSWLSDRDPNEKLLAVELKNPKLYVQSTKEKKTDGFDPHNSPLDSANGHPFFVHLKNGKIVDAYADESEPSSLGNIKSAVASLLQFQVTEGYKRESDVSGDCHVTYKWLDSVTFVKIKKECGQNGRKSRDGILGGNLTSSRTSTYKLSETLTKIESVTTSDDHEFVIGVKKEAGSSILATQHLISSGATYKVSTIVSSSLENAIREIADSRKLKLVKRSLRPMAFSPDCDKEDCPSLPRLLKENREHLSSSNLGTFKSAAAFVKLLSAARNSTKGDLAKVFKGSKNKEILTQLCDLAGAIQSEDSHNLIMKIVNFDAEKDFDLSERYLWALATGSHPRESVIRDIFKMSQRELANEKIDETILLALASMTRKFHRLPGKENNPLGKEIADSMMRELEICPSENCKIKYLRALRNLKCRESIPVLIQHALKGKTKASTEAMKALRSFEPSRWTNEVVDTAQKIYFQAGRKYDSSCRTLALDILLESKHRRELLEELLLSLVHRDPAYEVKQYLVQRVNQISEKDEGFAKIVDSIKKKFFPLFNNYHIGAQRGLTTAFERIFAESDYRNGTLSTVLEISKGLLKRGAVDVVVENSGGVASIFTLGLFAGGLSSFVSSDEGDREEIEEGEEVATAGMELTVLGSQMRPFTFFTGQGELMGHVFSGTASEKTPAFQAILLPIDYSEQIALQNGFWVEVEALGAVSFDLSGQIQISLWNRNAHSLVEKDAGISLQGGMKIRSSFVHSQIEFNVFADMKLNLQSDINFYGGNSLCMQLSQPEVVIRHNVHKIERIPGGKHRLRRSKYTQIKVPGRTYALNKKNNEMCNIIFS